PEIITSDPWSIPAESRQGSARTRKSTRLSSLRRRWTSTSAPLVDEGSSTGEGRPVTSSLLHPRIFSAAGFHDSTRPSDEIATIAVGTACRTSLKIPGSNFALLIMNELAVVRRDKVSYEP